MKTRKWFEYESKNTTFARQNRRFLTKTEWLFWHCVLKKKWLGYRFLRQKPIWNYILDFYCSKLLLAIEIDWVSHEESVEYDNKRDRYLDSLWIKTIRYRDEDVLKNMEWVIVDLESCIKKREKEMGRKKPLPFGRSPWKGEEVILIV